MPPMMVYPRKRMDPQLLLNSALGACGVCNDSGWMTTDLFLGWFKKFIEFSGATVERPVLLLLDEHSTHTQNIELISEARAHGVIILCFSLHTTHRLQVFDVAYMRPLSTYYDQQITAWLRSNPGMVVTIRQMAEIFGKAFIQASTKCGIWPYDPTVFCEIDFAASLMTDIPQAERLPVTVAPTAATTAPTSVSATVITTSLITDNPQAERILATEALTAANSTPARVSASVAVTTTIESEQFSQSAPSISEVINLETITATSPSILQEQSSFCELEKEQTDIPMADIISEATTIQPLDA